MFLNFALKIQYTDLKENKQLQDLKEKKKPCKYVGFTDDTLTQIIFTCLYLQNDI